MRIAIAGECRPVGWRGVGLDVLRARLRRLERGGVGGDRRALPLGVAAIDRLLPGGGLEPGRTCGLAGAGRGEVRDGAVTGFAAALLVRLLAAAPDGGPVLWCGHAGNRGGGMISGHGLAGFGLDPGRLIWVEAAGPAERLRIFEEALRCPGLLAAVGEVEPGRGGGGRDGATIARRLQLAAESGGVTGLLLQDGGRAESGGALPLDMRWQVRPAPGSDWRPCWRVSLLRARNGRTGAWTLCWDARAARLICRDGARPEDRADDDAAGRSGQQSVQAPVPHRQAGNCQAGDEPGRRAGRTAA